MNELIQSLQEKIGLTAEQAKDASTGSNHTVSSLANHINNLKNSGGQGFGAYNYQIVALEEVWW